MHLDRLIIFETVLFSFIKDHHSNMVEYHVPVAPGGVASIFNQLESNKAVLQIQHFSVSQTTLDEVRHIIKTFCQFCHYLHVFYAKKLRAYGLEQHEVVITTEL